MPTYVYECPSCGSQKEIVRRITDREELPTCESFTCPSIAEALVMRRVITPSTFVLKGSGWAKDGYTGGKK